MFAGHLLLLGFLALTQAAAPAVDNAVVERALAVVTEAERAAFYAAHPDIATGPTRDEIAKRAGEKFAAGDIAGALNAHRLLLYAATQAGNARGRIIALSSIGTFAGQTGDFALAESTLRDARAEAEASRHADLLTTALNNLGIVLRLQGKYDEAIESYERNLKVAEAAGRRDSVGRTLNNLGIIAQMKGDARAALDYYERSLAIRNELGLVDETIHVIFNIGVVHHHQRNLPLALDHYQRSRAAAEKAGNRREVNRALNNIANVYAIQGRFADASTVLRQVLVQSEAMSDRVQTATIWHNLGMIDKEERRWSDAEAAFQRSLQMREALGERRGESENLIGLADLFLTQKQYERALGFAERAVDVSRSIGAAFSLWGALSLVGSANAELGRTEAAVRAFEQSIDVVERMRERVAGGDQDLQRFFEDKSEPYFELAAVQAAAGRPADAFRAVERARARVLLALIEGGKPIVRTLTEEERAREVQLDRDLGVLNARRATVAAQKLQNPDRLTQIDDELARVRRAKDDFQFRIYAAHPDLRFGRGEAPIVSLEDAAAVVPPDTAIAIFMTTDRRTSLLLLTRTAAQKLPVVEVFPIDITRADLIRRTGAFAQQLGQRDLSFTSEARSLYTLLFGAADRHLARVKRVVVVPDGTLWNVPFQALMTPRGRYLIEERAVSYAPSVSALHRLQARRLSRASQPARLVAIGDPVLDAARATRLPEAAREIRSLAAMYGSTSAAFLAKEATEARLRAAAPTASVLHIATHGELVSSSPMYSSVLLTGTGGANDPSQDGRVEAWEIANLNLHADLAVLSACETALGEDSGGEGVVGLSWSLFAAGASTAAVSLWRVDSSSTTELMLAFHKSLLAKGKERSPAEAMQSAARSLIASSEYRHPFYWAGFVVIGAP